MLQTVDSPTERHSGGVVGLALWERPPCLLRVGKLQAQRGMCSWQMARGQLSQVWRVQGAMLSFIPHGVCFLKTVSVGQGPLTCH